MASDRALILQTDKRKLHRITEGRIRTNPGWAIQAQKENESRCQNEALLIRQQIQAWIHKLEETGISFSRHIRASRDFRGIHLKSEPAVSPRIVGLLVHAGTEGFVNPLYTRRNPKGWKISQHYLPFNEGHIQDALLRLLQSAGLLLDQSVPELIGFSIDEELNELSAGSSMHIAGLLSVVDAMNNHSCVQFECACAVVMPQGNSLVSVKSTEAKLAAFKREFGRATLLVCPQQFDVPFHLRDCFPEHVLWRVGSFADLANWLSEIGQLDAFVEEFPIGQAALKEAKNRLRWFALEKDNSAALSFAERLHETASRQGKTTLRIRQAIELELEELNRHLGRFVHAIRHSESAVSQLEQLQVVASYQEIVEAKTRLAAALLDGHQFQRGIEMLEPLVERIDDHRYLITAEAEIYLKNTLARLLVAAKKVGWEKLFRESLSCQEIVDPEGTPRTKCYLIHGLLRNSRLEDAQRELTELSKLDLDLFTKTFANYYKADLARRQGKQWHDEEFEKAGNHVKGHPFALYWQATARQPGWNDVARAKRLVESVIEFRKEVNEFTELNLMELFSKFICLAKALFQECPKAAKIAIDEIEDFLRHPDAADLQIYYEDKMPDATDSWSKVEPLLAAVPYF